MPAISATAPGKIILFGEHAVVYGEPAIAVPVSQVKARAIVTANPHQTAGWVQVTAPDINLDSQLNTLPPEDPIGKAVLSVFSTLGISNPPAFNLRITSTIPIAAGLGSGAAVSAAILRAVSAFLGYPFEDEQVSALSYEIDVIHHGTPSGIDNTVVTFEKPVYFIKGQPIQMIQVPTPFTIVIADTGVPSPTSVAVSDVRTAWKEDPKTYKSMFNAIGEITRKARQTIEDGLPEKLGALMVNNHELLEKMGVSSPKLRRLVSTARESGASGAKLSGAGRGGNMIALVGPENAREVADALVNAGAKGTIITRVGNKRM
jgi:mevalonate kinase